MPDFSGKIVQIDFGFGAICKTASLFQGTGKQLGGFAPVISEIRAEIDTGTATDT
jgi:hypothetical protein